MTISVIKLLVENVDRMAIKVVDIQNVLSSVRVISNVQEEDLTNGRAEVSDIKSTPLESPLKEDKEDLFSGTLREVG